jgi:hypothetical protein
MKKRLLVISVFVLFLSTQTTFLLAQNGCAATLSEAQDSFEAGHLYAIPATLKPCLDNGFSPDERKQAYWLLTRTYLIIDDPISAEDSYLKLLRLDPEYIIDEEKDPIEVVLLSKKFKTTPIFTWTYFKVGLNTTSAEHINTYTTGNNNNNNAKYSGSLGFQMSSELELNVNDNWSLNAEFVFARRSFSYTNTLFGEDHQSLTENQSWLEMPFFIKYSRAYDKFHPYVYGGYGLQFLLSSTIKPELNNREPAEDGTFSALPVNGDPITVTNSRTRFTQSAIAGAGVRYRVGYAYLMFEARYTIGLRNLLDKNNQYPQSGDAYSNELTFRYGYVDSDFKINSLSMVIGVVKPLYKPRKIDERPHFIQRLFKRKGGKKK